MPHVVVRGISGSGKSWLCRALAAASIECVDTDDWLHAGKTRKQLLAHLATRPFVAVVGITIRVPPDEGLYFIKIVAADFPATYKRVLARELKKIVDQAPAILKTIETKTPREINDALGRPQDFGLAMSITDTIQDYKRMYKGAVAYEKARGAKVLTQDKVLVDITRLRDRLAGQARR